MKKGLLLTTSLAMVLGVGIAVGAHRAESVKEVKADSTIDIYCTKSFDYLIDDIRVHQWGGDTPGTTWGWDSFSVMTKAFDNKYGQPVFKLTIPSDRTGLIFISKQGDAMKQTVNIESGIEDNACWYFDGWSGDKMNVGKTSVHPYTINYYGNGSTSGSMSSETAYSDVSWGLTANSYSKTGYVFDKWTTNADGSGTSYTDSALVEEGSIEGNTLDLYAQWRKEYPAGRYIVGSFCSWSIDGAVYMNKTSEIEYSVTNVSLAMGDEFKIAYYNGSSLESYFGYDTSIGGGLFCFSKVETEDDSYNNFKCWASGSYSFYFTDENYGEGKKSSVEISGSKWNAEQLAAKLMSYGEYEGHCGDEDRFPVCKEKFLDMDPTEQAKFEGFASSEVAQFKNAYDRYVAWASALHQKPFEEGTTSSSMINIMSDGQNSDFIIIIAIISSVTLISTGLLLFLKKRKMK